MADASLIDFDTAQTLTASDLLYVGVVDTGVAEGYNDNKATLTLVAQAFNNQFQFSSQLAKTTSKTVLGAINEIAYKEIIGTLTAGSTSITLSDALITTSSTIDIFTDTFGVCPETVTLASGSVTLTFEAQSSNLAVKVRVW